MSKVLKIAITGKMRAGKSEAAWRLFHAHGFHYPISFGMELKHTADRLFPAYAKRGGKPRELYQRFGQLCRSIDENVWIYHVENDVKMALERRSTTGIVIADLRQPNEYEWCKRNGFVIIRVNASEDTRLARANAEGDVFTVEDLHHETEMHVDNFDVDYDIWNDGGDLAEMHHQIDEIMSKLID